MMHDLMNNLNDSPHKGTLSIGLILFSLLFKFFLFMFSLTLNPEIIKWVQLITALLGGVIAVITLIEKWKKHKRR